MARISNLEKLPLTALVKLQADIAAKITTKQTEEKAALMAEFAALANKRGVKLEDLLGGPKRKGVKVAVKYRDPNNPDNTWTGRGRMPLWMVEATKKRGVNREDFEV